MDNLQAIESKKTELSEKLEKVQNAKEISESLLKALSFHGKTTGRNCIIEKGLSNEEIAKQILEKYHFALRD